MAGAPIVGSVLARMMLSAGCCVGLTLGGGRREQEDVVCWVRCGLYYRQRRRLRMAMYIVASMVTALLYLQQRRWWRVAFVVGPTLGGGRREQQQGDVVCWVRCGPHPWRWKAGAAAGRCRLLDALWASPLEVEGRVQQQGDVICWVRCCIGRGVGGVRRCCFLTTKAEAATT